MLEPYTNEVIYTEAICPSCGQKGAKIHHTFWGHNEHSFYFKHEVCGYSEQLSSYVESVLHRHFGTSYTQSLWQLEKFGFGDQLILTVTQDKTQAAVNALKEIKHFTNNFFQKIFLKMSGAITGSSCPICHEDHFQPQGHELICSNHYQAPAVHIFSQYLGEIDYSFESRADRGDVVYTIYQEVTVTTHFLGLPFLPLHSVHTQPVAKVVFRVDYGSNRRILIIGTTEGSNDEVLQNFIVLIESKFSTDNYKDCYTIIIKEE